MTETSTQIFVYINEADEWRHRPLHLEILRLLESEGLWGGTVVRGVAGFTAHESVHSSSLVDAGGELPLVVQFADSSDNVARVLPRIREMAPDRMITVHSVQIVP